MKRVLMIAFHYPPTQGSSGLQRSLKFSRYLGEHGWDPLMLTVHPRAYPATTDDQLHEIPDDLVVRRAFALDTARHLAVGGRYPGFLSVPDRWVSWWLGAVPAGLALIRKYRPDVIWSTYPIATANLIGATLARLSRLPWVVDLRDSMTEESYPADTRTWRAYRRIESRAARYARRVVFTAPGALAMYRERYPEQPSSRWALIPNGYDEDNFTGITPAPQAGARLTLLHSGALYPSERDPRPFFDALSTLKRRGLVAAERFQVVLRATGHDEVFAPMLRDRRIGDLVTLAPPVPYRQALAEMMSVDGLLIFQAANCNHQIPAKVFEYMRAGRPVLALTDPDGDTGRLVRENRMGAIAWLDSAEDIVNALTGFISALRTGNADVTPPERVIQYSRRAQTGQLARLLDDAIDDENGVSGNGDRC